MVLFCGNGPSGELSWWGILVGIVVPVGNGWALFLSGGELSLVGSCPRTVREDMETVGVTGEDVEDRRKWSDRIHCGDP